MSTKNDLLTCWAILTGSPISEARHRIRVLSEAGLLPRRADPLTLADLARAFLGFLGSDTHKDAVEAVRSFSEFRSSTYEGGERQSIADFSPQAIGKSTLLDAIILALQPQFKLMAISVSSARMVELHVRITGHPVRTDYYLFTGPITSDLYHKPYPVVVTKSIYHELISRLVILVNAPTETHEES